MARIRTIKPEFWDSPGTARASLRARLFYIALWNWADDYGIGTANARQLIGFAFPNDDDVTDADFPRLRAEVAECFGTLWYEVDGRPYYAIPAWDDHQKNERRAKGRNPGPDQAERFSTETHGTSVQTRGASGTGTGEQGNRGTGEDSPIGESAPAVADARPTPKKKPTTNRGTRIPEPFPVTPDMVEWARAETPGLDHRAVTARFVDHWKATPGARGVKLDWVATWRNWLRREYDGPTGGRRLVTAGAPKSPWDTQYTKAPE